jgi:hypothetical protein
MNIGMLWLDADVKSSFEEKVMRAVAYYEDKYGRAPDLCVVNSASFAEDERTVGQVKVQRAKTVLPNHFWVGLGTA